MRRSSPIVRLRPVRSIEAPSPAMIRTQTASHPELTPAAGAVDKACGVRRLREVDGLVQALVASWNSCGPVLERRRWHRVPFGRLLGITPLDGGVIPLPAGEMRAVQGRDISLSGIAFSHTRPIPNRTVAVTFWDESGAANSIVTELNWCRFTRGGEYQSGGKFLQIIELPEATRQDSCLLPLA